MSPERKSGWRFTARFTYGCNEVLLGSKARALKYFCLPCDPAGKINSLYNDEVYHWKSNSICMNEMCDDVSHGALQKWSFLCRPLFKQNVKNMKKWKFKKELPGEAFNSTSHPSGNLVDGLPLDLHTDATRYCLVVRPEIRNIFSCPLTLLGR